MADLSAFPITKKWSAKHPDRIQLYSLATPNGVKASIALEELGLPYEVHKINILQGDQHTPEFRSLNPNAKIPAMIDPDGPGGRPLGLFESGTILTYLSDKTGKLIPVDAAQRYECLAWVFFQVGSVGPMFGQFDFFHRFGGKDIADPRPKERYRTESKRLLGVLEERLDGREWLMGDLYTIADIAIFPWVRNMDTFYDAREALSLGDYTRTYEWSARCAARPASVKGLDVPPRQP